MITEGIYANIFIPVDLKRSPKYIDEDKGRGIVEANGGWIPGAMPNLSEAKVPSEPFIRKLKNDVPISLKSMTGFIDHDPSEFLQSIVDQGTESSLRIVAEWKERDSKRIDIRMGERFHRYAPTNYQFGIDGIYLFALEYFLNFDGISVIVIHVFCNENKRYWEMLESIANLHSTSISGWLLQCFEGLGTDISDLCPPGMNYGLCIALAEGDEESIEVSSSMIIRRKKRRNEDIWDLRSKYVFLGILLTIQKAALYDIRAHWPIFTQAPSQLVSKMRDSLFTFLNRYWWIKISDNKAFTALYDEWHRENKTQEQINQLVSEMQLHWQERESETSKASAQRIEKIAEWGSVAAFVALVPTWESLFVAHLTPRAVTLSLVVSLSASLLGLGVYRRLFRK